MSTLAFEIGTSSGHAPVRNYSGDSGTAMHLNSDLWVYPGQDGSGCFSALDQGPVVENLRRRMLGAGDVILQIFPRVSQPQYSRIGASLCCMRSQ